MAVRIPDALPLRDLWIPAADLPEVEKTLIVNMGDHKADLVGMSGEHHSGLAAFVDDGDDVALGVYAHLISERFCFGGPDLGRFVFITGGADGREQTLEKF